MMKKYVKPDLYYEDMMLNVSVATGCDTGNLNWVSAMSTYNGCGVTYDGEVVFFNGGKCNTTDTSLLEAYCEFNSIDSKTVLAGS